jgi:transposase
MDHIAIDLGGRKSQLCVRAPTGEISLEGKCDTAQLGAWLSSRAPARVVMETCAESITVAHWARAAGHDVRVVPATLAPSLGVGARGIKTDVRDARALSEASCRMPELPSVHLRSQTARERQVLVGMRQGLVEARTQLINTVKGWLRTQVLRMPKHTPQSLPRVLREAHGEKLLACVQRQLDAIQALTDQIKQANAELEETAEADAVCARLMSVPGVGKTTAICFAAIVDDVARFPNAKTLTSYLGLTPGERSSSDTRHRTSLTKAGSSLLRMLLTQCAWWIWQRKQDAPIGRWAAGIAARRGKMIAVVAIARKLAGILFALWRDGTTYDERKAAFARA